MAGEVVAVGDLVKKWAPGDRVCANFSIDHIHGDVSDELRKAFLGFFIDGVLAEYRVFPEHVSLPFGPFAVRLRVIYPHS